MKTKIIILTSLLFMPLVDNKFEVKEFVFLGFLGVGGFSLFRTQKTNENNKNQE